MHDLNGNLAVVWGLFAANAWPVPFENVIPPEREELLRRFVDAAHARGIKVLAGAGIYSWGFDEVIRKVPGSGAGHAKAMCAHSDIAWDWQRRTLDFQMDPRWGLDGISMQSADLGRCECERCKRLSASAHHRLLLVRCAQHVRAARPEWIIGQAAWGMRVDEAEQLAHVQEISKYLDYMIEVRERSARGEAGRRATLIRSLHCAFGSVGGIFVEPPPRWDRLRWFVPCGLTAANNLKRLHADGGQAAEHYVRPFANPAEEVSWRTGARVLSAPDTEPMAALTEAVVAVYGVSGRAAEDLADWYRRAEEAYFTRTLFKTDMGPLQVEVTKGVPPNEPGYPHYLMAERFPAEQFPGYKRDLEALREELPRIPLGRPEAARRTLACIDGTLADLAAVECGAFSRFETRPDAKEPKPA